MPLVRQRPVGRGPAGEPGLSAAPAPLAPETLLRAALELALDVARRGAGATPAVEPPRGLRPFLRFGHLPDRALPAVQRVLQDDDDFRRRVAEAADEVALGRAGWLFVARPEGWEDELAALAGDARARAEVEREAEEERTATRRVRKAEEAARRAEEGAERARADAARAATELAEERRERRAAEEQAAHLGRAVSALRAELQAEGEAARRAADQAAREVEELRARLSVLEAEVAGRPPPPVPPAVGTARPRPPSPAPPPAPAVSVHDRPAAPGTGPVQPPPPPTAGPALDAEALARALADAGGAAEALARALAHAAAALPPAGGAGQPTAAPAPAVRPAPPRPAKPAAAGPGSPGRRRPAALPPALFDDSPEAAAHLVRLPGAIVLVDGYNASKMLWPELAVPELRQRLVDALGELAARTGSAIHVVFDGAEVPGPPPTAWSGRQLVRVSFSPPDVEADDVILELVDAMPRHRPVIVASSDRRVQQGGRHRGANVISSDQLGAVLGRA